MKIICKNCKNEFVGHYCNNCGQEAKTNKINFHFLWYDIQKEIFHFHKGVFYSLKELYTNPGRTIREYIEGKRVKHYRPFSLVIILAGVYAFLYTFVHIDVFSEVSSSGNGLNSENEASINQFFGAHFSWINILLLPISSLITFLIFIKQGYNFVEHIVVNCYLASQRLFLRIVTFPILYQLNSTHHVGILSKFLIVIDIVVMTWTISQLFVGMGKLKSTILSILSYFLILIMASSIFAAIILYAK